MNAELLKIRDAIEAVIEDGSEDDLGLAAMILDRVVEPLLAEHASRLNQLRAYARWCNDRSVEPETRDILNLANGEECHDYVALLKRQGGGS
jgi:hypothetical protein